MYDFLLPSDDSDEDIFFKSITGAPWAREHSSRGIKFNPNSPELILIQSRAALI